MKKKVQIILAITVMFSFLTGCGSKEKMELKAESKDIEYGESISHDPKDYLTNEDEDFLKEVKVETTAENEDNKQYPAIGEYEIILTYKDQIEKVKVSVKDTTAPQFVDIEDQYEVAYNTKLDNGLFKATDLSEVTVTLDDGNVDYKKAGEYQATVTAKDTAGNETKKEMTVVVKAEEKEKTTTSSGNSSSTTKPAASNTAANKPSSSSTASKPGSGSSSTAATKPSTNTSSTSDSNSTSSKPGSTVNKNYKLNASSKTINVGDTFQVKLVSGDYKSLKWVSNNTKIATIDNNGVVIGKAFGATYVYPLVNGETVNDEKGNPVTCDITVNNPSYTWAMSEAEMTAYAKQCVTSFKPTSGHGSVGWEDSFNKNNSGWFAPISVNISMSESEIKERIQSKVNATLKKTTSQIFDDGEGNIREDECYSAKVYFEKADDNSYKVYVLY